MGHIQYSEKASKSIATYPKILLVQDPRDYIISQLIIGINTKRIETPLTTVQGTAQSGHQIDAAIFGMMEVRKQEAI